MTNYIEDVPDALQPITIGELIHMIHLIARLQNTYYDKHLAAAALHNKEHMIGGRFSIENESLVILFEMPEHEAEILLSSRDSFPMLQYNKNLFADYLNTRGNKALQEVMYSEYTLPQLRNFLEKSPVEFHVGEYSQTLSNEYDNIHFTR